MRLVDCERVCRTHRRFGAARFLERARPWSVGWSCNAASLSAARHCGSGRPSPTPKPALAPAPAPQQGPRIDMHQSAHTLQAASGASDYMARRMLGASPRRRPRLRARDGSVQTAESPPAPGAGAAGPGPAGAAAAARGGGTRERSSWRGGRKPWRSSFSRLADSGRHPGRRECASRSRYGLAGAQPLGVEAHATYTACSARRGTDRARRRPGSGRHAPAARPAASCGGCAYMMTGQHKARGLAGRQPVPSLPGAQLPACAALPDLSALRPMPNSTGACRRAAALLRAVP